MRNLFLFLWKSNFLVLFLLIETYCFYLIFTDSNFHQATLINSANFVTAKVNETVNAVTEYVSLKKVNEALASENALLHASSRELYYNTNPEAGFINDTSYRQQYSFFNAKVINNSVNRRNNYLTLNKGRLQGIKPEMGVVSSEGLVGIVKDVSDHFCSVMSFLHKDSRISAKVKKSGYIGSLVWDGYDDEHGSLKDIARHVKVAKGDTIVTSSYSSIFPEGIMIGTIDEFAAKAGDNFYTISVKLSTDFSKLSYVSIVNNVLKKEQQKLEEKQKDDR